MQSKAPKMHFRHFRNTLYIIASLDPSTTGIYGWINEEYLDGAGWVPDEDYVATERPW